MRPLALILPLATFVLIAGCQPQQTVAPVHYRSFRTGGKRTGTITADGRMRNAYVGSGKVCAEPPPDIAANYGLERAISASVSLSIAYSGVTGEGSGSGQSAWKGVSEVADVAEKTEALLVVREALYRLCELTLNNKVETQQVVQTFREILFTTRDLGRNDVLKQIIDAIEYSVSFEGTTVEMIAELTQLAAHIATIETYQNALLTVSALPPNEARGTLLDALSSALATQISVFPPPAAAVNRQPLATVEVGVFLTTLSLGSAVLSKVANKGWKLAKVPPTLDKAGFNPDDIIASIRANDATHDLTKMEAIGLEQLASELSAADVTTLEVVIDRKGTTHTVEIGP